MSNFRLGRLGVPRAPAKRAGGYKKKKKGKKQFFTAYRPEIKEYDIKLTSSLNNGPVDP